MNEQQAKAAQKKYVEARLSGASPIQARDIAGYSQGSAPSVLEKPGTPIHNAMVAALHERGIDEQFLAREYLEAIDAAKQPGAKEKDLNAAAQLYKQLGFLLGYGRKESPTVAVQINNGVGGQADDPGATRELITEIAALVETLTSEVGKDRNPRLHDGDSESSDAASRSGVVKPTQETPIDGSGGRA